MLLGLHGRAGSGKDQSYQFIVEWAGTRQIRREGFADRLKFSAARALGYRGTAEECIALCNTFKKPGWEIIVRNYQAGEEHAISGREYLQYYGTEAHREVFHQDFWIDAVLNYYCPDELLVVTDVRFVNEAQAIHDAGGEVWQIVRSGASISEAEHASEQPLPPDLIDHIVVNDRDLDHLRTLIQTRIEELVHACHG